MFQTRILEFSYIIGFIYLFLCAFKAYNFMKRCQLDLIIRFWDNESSEVKTNYLTSSFLTKATAINMKNAFVDAMLSLQLPLKKIVSISMDGPNVNKSMLRELKAHIKNENDEECPEIFDLGTCGLHVVHGAYKTAHNSTHWDIHAFLRALFYLFNDHPSRRGDYCFYSESELFPLKFCSVRWIENGAVIARAINILKNVKKYVEGVKDNPPNSTCFLKVQRFLVDDLLAAKLHFLQSIISDLEPFLTKYQSNKPLLPFLYEDLNHVLGVIGERLIKDVFKTVQTSHQLQSVVRDEKSLKTVGAVDIGFGASSVLNQLKTLKDLEKLKFKQDCRNFLKSLIEKLCERSPGKLRMVKGASCFYPNVMTSETLPNFRIQIALEEFVDKKQMSPGVADIVKRSYGQLCESQKVMLKEWDNESLDYFLMNLTLRAGIKDSHFFKFMQSILVMFHGNAEVERGFSVNKQCLCENMVEKSLISQRIICDAVSAAGGVTKVNVTKNMILAVRNSSSFRREALSEAKKFVLTKI